MDRPYKIEDLFADCLQFVKEQSAGEWGHNLEISDATALTRFVALQIDAALAQEDSLS